MTRGLLRLKSWWILPGVAAIIAAQAWGAENFPETTNAMGRPVPVALTPPPPLPLAHSPVDSFRALLAMPAPQRAQALAGRSPEIRERILAKIREYEAMKPDDRELRLRMTQLRWYLHAFLDTSATNRTAQLALLPEADRQIVADHLREWDLLTPEQQQEVLRYESTISSLPKNAATNTPVLTPVSAPIPSPVATLDEWNSLSPEKRQQVVDHFTRFFELTSSEKERTLHQLSAAELNQMQRSLHMFESLPKERRERCLRSFPIFAGMSNEEREEFLQNAARWKELTPAERQSWRTLVSRLPPPPMPPGVMPPMPPLPPGVGMMPVPMPTRGGAAPLATNGD